MHEDAAHAQTATLAGLDAPIALAFDSSGNLYVANYGNDTVSEVAPGNTTPTASSRPKMRCSPPLRRRLCRYASRTSCASSTIKGQNASRLWLR